MSESKSGVYFLCHKPVKGFDTIRWKKILKEPDGFLEQLSVDINEALRESEHGLPAERGKSQTV